MSSDKGPDDPDYPVGYGKPPQASRFVKGQSGNPKGRPPKPKSAELTVIERVANEVCGSIMLRGKKRPLTLEEGLLRKAIAAAVQGDLKEAALLHDEEMKQSRDEIQRRTGSANPKPQPELGVVLIPYLPDEMWEILAPIQQRKLMEATLSDLAWREAREAQEAADAR